MYEVESAHRLFFSDKISGELMVICYLPLLCTHEWVNVLIEMMEDEGAKQSTN